jgi:hypothetical protein
MCPSFRDLSEGLYALFREEKELKLRQLIPVLVSGHIFIITVCKTEANHPSSKVISADFLSRSERNCSRLPQFLSDSL